MTEAELNHEILRRLTSIEAQLAVVKELEHRVTLLEVRSTESEKREAVVIDGLLDKVNANNAMVKKLFDKFDAHISDESNSQRQLVQWMRGLIVSVITVGATLAIAAVNFVMDLPT